MLFFIRNTYCQFFAKNIFERLIVYITLSSVVSVFYSEAILKQAVYYNPRTSQWIFYLLLAVDYLVSIKKVVTTKISFNAMTAFAVSLFFMIVHGLIVGLYNENPWFLIFNDIIPFLMIALNILRMQSLSENATPIDFGFLLRFCGFVSVCSTLSGLIIQTAGLLRTATFKIDIIYLCLFFAALVTTYKKLRWVDIAYFVIVFSFAVKGLNRTTLAFMGLIATVIFIKNFLKNPIKGSMIMVISIVAIAIGFSFLPKDSPIYKRIVASQNIDLNKRTGSIGERQQEKDSVNLELHKKGRTDELVGMGMGGTYTMKTTFTTIKNYGHAHFSWVWFKMRFGEIGYVYLAILSLALIASAVHNSLLGGHLGAFLGLLCGFSVLYLFTFVNALFLLSGLQFLYIRQDQRKNYVVNY
jgi:hypothetical protein